MRGGPAWARLAQGVPPRGRPRRGQQGKLGSLRCAVLALCTCCTAPHLAAPSPSPTLMHAADGTAPPCRAGRCRTRPAAACWCRATCTTCTAVTAATPRLRSGGLRETAAAAAAAAPAPPCPLPPAACPGVSTTQRTAHGMLPCPSLHPAPCALQAAGRPQLGAGRRGAALVAGGRSGQAPQDAGARRAQAAAPPACLRCLECAVRIQAMCAGPAGRCPPTNQTHTRLLTSSIRTLARSRLTWSLRGTTPTAPTPPDPVALERELRRHSTDCCGWELLQPARRGRGRPPPPPAHAHMPCTALVKPGRRANDGGSATGLTGAGSEAERAGATGGLSRATGD